TSLRGSECHSKRSAFPVLGGIAHRRADRDRAGRTVESVGSYVVAAERFLRQLPRQSRSSSASAFDNLSRRQRQSSSDSLRTRCSNDSNLWTSTGDGGLPSSARELDGWRTFSSGVRPLL